MSQRNLRNAIPAIIVLTALLSLLVCGQTTPQPQPSKPKTTTKRKTAARKTAPTPTPPVVPQPTLEQPAAVPTAASPTTPVTTDAAATPASTKKPGVLRIGVVLPITQVNPEAGLAMSEAVRQLWISYLNGPAAEAVPLDARVPVQAELEAKQKECDFVFYSAVGRRQRSSSLAKLVKTAAPVASMIPVGGAANAAASTATTTTTDKALKAATDLSGNIKARDEISVEFKLAAPGQPTPKLAHVLKAKAKTDGDQILATLLAEAANAVLQAATQ